MEANRSHFVIDDAGRRRYAWWGGLFEVEPVGVVVVEAHEIAVFAKIDVERHFADQHGALFQLSGCPAFRTRLEAAHLSGGWCGRTQTIT
ncbi:hypothetical protein ACGFT2_06380 [Streptomyces sp. NPDC048514]|uniref:hypothetical protein n=1 Tax=Streptomyces sp. NPDC048514 TaxID=3365564 RepID=UPI00371614CF